MFEMKAVRFLHVCLFTMLAACQNVRDDRSGSAAGEAKLNFLIILVDDLGPEQLGCYGSATNHTPHIDKLAEAGMRFRTAYATPICTPSRVLLMTGRYGFRTGWLNFTGRKGSPTVANPDYNLGREEKTFAHLLKDNGYRTGLMGRWLSVGNEHKQIPDAGFSDYQIWGIWGQKLPPGVRHTGAWEREGVVTARYWHPAIIRDGKYVPTQPDDYGPDLMVEYGKNFLRRHKDKPFMLFYPMILVHDPYPPVPDLENPGARRKGDLKSFVEYTDHLTGQLLDELDALGLRESTVVIFAGDNGTMRQGKGTPTEKGARVPLIIRNPKHVKKGVVSDELTDFSDVFPTLMAFAGVSMPEGIDFDGKSLVRALAGSTEEHRPWIYSYFIEGQVLRDKRWLLEDGRFYDCGSDRDGRGYADVTASTDPDVVAARVRLEGILAPLAARPSQLLEKTK